MELYENKKAEAAKLATEDYIKKYHKSPNLEFVLGDYAVDKIVFTFKADDMAYYYFTYNWVTSRFEMYTFYRDNVKMWSEEV